MQTFLNQGEVIVEDYCLIHHLCDVINMLFVRSEILINILLCSILER